jgi:hypothetical protein
VKVTEVGAGDHARACSAFVDGLEAPARLAHRAQAVLDDAVLAAVRRPLGDAWLWSRRRSAASIAPLVAVTLAAWGARRTPPPGRPAVTAATPAPSPHRPQARKPPATSPHDRRDRVPRH